MGALDDLMSDMLDQIDNLTDGLLAGHTDVTGWHNDMVRLFGDYHSAAFMLGQDSADLTPQQRDMLLRRIGDQVDYLNKFAADLDAEKLSPEQTRWRARLYAGAIKDAHSRGATWGWDLPVYPTEDCEGQVNCQCSWQINTLDGDGNADAYWRLGASEHCPRCLQHAAEYGPLRFRGGKRQ